MTMNKMAFDKIPGLPVIFDRLRRGYHITQEDGELFWTIKANEELLSGLFSALGFDFQADARGFYYFRGRGPLSDRSGRMALFMFILVEWLADRGEMVQEVVLAGRFSISELPHLKMERYQSYLREAGISGDDGLLDIIRSMERYGFLKRKGRDEFVFRPPVVRFLDLCREALSITKADEEDQDGSDHIQSHGQEGESGHRRDAF